MKALLSCLVVVLFALSILSAATPSYGTTPTLTSCAAVANSKSYAVTKDSSGNVVMADAVNGTVYIQNTSTCSVKKVQPPAGSHAWTSVTFHSGTILVIGNGGIWEFRESSATLSSGDIYTATWKQLDIETKSGGTFSSLSIGSVLTSLFITASSANCNGFSGASCLYAASGNQFYKIANLSAAGSTNGWGSSTDQCGQAFPTAESAGAPYPNCYNVASGYGVSTEWGFTPSGSGNFEGIVNDSVGNIFISDRADGKILVYCSDATTTYCSSINTPKTITGVSKPIGLAYANNVLYIGSNDATAPEVVEFALSGLNGASSASASASPHITTTAPVWGSSSFTTTLFFGTNGTGTNQICEFTTTNAIPSCTNVAAGVSAFGLLSPSATITYFGYDPAGVSGVGVVDWNPAAPSTSCPSVWVTANMGEWPIVSPNGTSQIVGSGANYTIPFYASLSDSLPASWASTCGLSIDSLSYDRLSITQAAYSVDGGQNVTIPLSSLIHQREVVSCSDGRFFSNANDWSKCGGAMIYFRQTWNGNIKVSLPPNPTPWVPHAVRIYAWSQAAPIVCPSGGRCFLSPRVGVTDATVAVNNGICCSGADFVLQFPQSKVGHYETLSFVGQTWVWGASGPMLQRFNESRQVLVPEGGTIYGNFMVGSKLTVSGSQAQTFFIKPDYSDLQTFTVT